MMSKNAKKRLAELQAEYAKERKYVASTEVSTMLDFIINGESTVQNMWESEIIEGMIAFLNERYIDWSDDPLDGDDNE